MSIVNPKKWDRKLWDAAGIGYKLNVVRAEDYDSNAWTGAEAGTYVAFDDPNAEARLLEMDRQAQAEKGKLGLLELWVLKLHLLRGGDVSDAQTFWPWDDPFVEEISKAIVKQEAKV